MKTYIFSNCKKTDNVTYGKNLLRSVPLDSRIVILNQGIVYYKIPEFFKYKNQILIMRSCSSHGLKGYFGMQDLVADYDHRPLFSEIIGIDFNSTDSVTLEIGAGYTKQKRTLTTFAVPWFKEYHEATKKYATTGYCAYYIIQKCYNVAPEDLVLVNFYGNSDNSSPKWPGHSWDYEDEWLKSKRRIFI